MVDTSLLNNFVAREVLGAGTLVCKILYITKSHSKILLKLVENLVGNFSIVNLEGTPFSLKRRAQAPFSMHPCPLIEE
jgi:hypothetical protein